MTNTYNQVTSSNYPQEQKGLQNKRFPIFSGLWNKLVTGANKIAADTIEEKTLANGVVIDGVTLKDGGITATTVINAGAGLTKGTANVEEFTVLTTLTATEIVGTSAGDIGHANGATLVAAPSSAYALEFVSAVLVYDYATAAYTGGANDLVIALGSGGAALSSAITDANLIGAAGDKVLRVGAIATEKNLTVGTTISLRGTAYTQPGTAAGVLRVYTTYRKIATGL